MLSMKRVVCTAVLGVTFLCFGAGGIAEAHSGRTDANGGHTCRTNCASWGLSQGEYHYHGGGSSTGGSSGESYTAPVHEATSLPINTPVPTRILTRIPTRAPTKIPTPTITVTNMPTTIP